jgi:hypothetical protein
MPYDAPMFDVAAVHYTVHPDSGLFDVSEPGTLSVGADGWLAVTGGAGNARMLSVNRAKANEVSEALITAASAKPAPPPQGRGRGGD